MNAPGASAFVAAVRRRWRTMLVLSRAGIALAGAALVLMVHAVAVRVLHLSGDVLAVTTAAALAAAVAWAIWAMRPARERPDDQRVARFIEERRPAFEDALVTAVQLRDDDRPFARAVRGHADAAVGSLAPSDIIASRDMRRGALRAAAGAAILSAVVAVSLGDLSRAWDAARIRVFPSAIALDITPGDARIVAGAPLQIRARVTGLPRSYDRPPGITIVQNGRRVRREMTAERGEFLVPLRSVAASFRYTVDIAGIRSREYTITVLRPPRIVGIDVAYVYPPYTGLAPRTETDAGDVYAPAGTRVTIKVRTDKTLRSGELRFNPPPSAETAADKSTAQSSQRSQRNESSAFSAASALLPSALLPSASSALSHEASFVVKRDTSYRVAVTDEDGLPNDSAPEYFVRVTDDRPPEVRILRPEGDRQVTPLEEVRVEARADDDYKLEKLELVYAIGSGPEHAIPIGPRGEQSISGSHLLALEDLRLKPGDIVRYYARALEQAHRAGGREARSDMFFLEVTPFDGRFALAQSQSGGGAMAEGDVQALIAAQKNVINATWNLLRRSQKLREGASANDVRALAQAQAELRVRTLALSGALTSASLMQQARGDQGSALGRAAAAMERAANELTRARLNDALPHEMDALTALMRAQSEDTKREVQQQSASSNYGNGRSGQDVSGLFDRELLRQQQTNYETQSPSDTRRKTPGSDAERRIRELAERQDDLARTQRQLASGQLDAAERQRELERLTRQQEQLRQEAEQLARDLSRERGNEGRSRAVRDAAQDMQNAGGDLRRNDVDSATRRGNRAAERLRGAEQDSAAGAGATAAQLQAEAQQLASEQRQLERSREGGATGAAGAADEQRRLADRADALERNLRNLSREGSGKDKAASTSATREMEQSRVAERMREAADRLQRGGADQKTGAATNSRVPQPRATSGSTPGSTPGSLASALDRVADRLGSAGDPHARKLNDELAKGRAARERLADLARQIERAQREGNESAREALSRAMQDAQRMLRELEQSQPGAGRASAQREGQPTPGLTPGSAPEQQEWSDSAPGLESFKQDFSRWEDLKRNAELAIERREAAIGRELAGIKTRDALAAGSIATLPEQYRARVARYFEALARAGRRP